MIRKAKEEAIKEPIKEAIRWPSESTSLANEMAP